jgi:Fe2+ transport system protein FeoA
MKKSVSQEKCGDCPAMIDKECSVGDIVRLSSYKPGEKGTIVQVCGNPEFRLRMMEMGFVKGSEVKVIKYAPLNDPMEFVIKGYHITLRRDQASDILMDRPERAA